MVDRTQLQRRQPDVVVRVDHSRHHDEVLTAGNASGGIPRNELVRAADLDDYAIAHEHTGVLEPIGRVAGVDAHEHPCAENEIVVEPHCIVRPASAHHQELRTMRISLHQPNIRRTHASGRGAREAGCAS